MPIKGTELFPIFLGSFVVCFFSFVFIYEVFEGSHAKALEEAAINCRLNVSDIAIQLIYIYHIFCYANLDLVQ